MLVLALALVLVAVALEVLRRSPAVAEMRRARRLTAKLPHPAEYPLLGTAALVACSQDELYDRIQKVASAYGPLTRVTLGHLTFVCVMDPHDMEAVMTSTKAQNKSLAYTVLMQVMGLGLVTLNGDEWRRHRKAITPSLHLDILKDFVHIFYKKGAGLASELEQRADSAEVFDVTPLCGACANNSICETVMSSDLDDDDPDKRNFLSNIPKALDHFMYRVFRPWFISSWGYSLHPTRYREYVQILNDTNSFIQRIVREKKENVQKTGEPNSRPKRRRAFLEHVLASAEGAALDEDELVEEVKTIVAVASGSSMDAIALTIYTLAIRQDIQDKVRDELSGVLGEGPGRAVEHPDLAHMQYTECVIKEVLRYFSVVPLFGRTVTEDLALPSGFTIPRGSQVAFWLPYTHRDPKWFPEPDKFDPDRFLPENSRGRHPFAFVPFSAGPRNCVGQRYAMMFMKTVVAAIVPRLRFEIPAGGPGRVEDIPLAMNLTMMVRGGANIRVHRIRQETLG
ncbi:Cytochrome P450 4V2 [Frankliniella fusca]|uniref:Cytochrome P450 4V2 n=1 Tax=Frankliniella fusca TaxID=407009 RepID=A0AAE1H343_9NEOP|nr:Cytochrome P450 4V2 [Frankliniella fusca]